MAAYLTLSFNVLGELDYFNNAYWSLPVEFQFYLLFPLFLLLVRWHPLALVAGALGLFALNGALALPGLTFQLAWQFAGGIGIGWLLERCPPILPGGVRPAIMAALLVTALAVSLLHHRLYYPRGVSDWTYLGALALPLVFLAAQSRPPVGRVGRAVGLRLQGGFREAVVYPFVLAGTFLASHVSFRAVERPGIALGRRLAVGSGRGRATA